MDTPILRGYQLYHNYIREHEALDGKHMPTNAVKIEGKKINGKLIQRSGSIKYNKV